MRARLADVGMLVTEALALFVLATALAAGAGGDGPSPLSVIAAMAGGFYLVRLLLNFDSGRPALIAAGIAGTAVALLAILNLQYDPHAGPWSLRWTSDLLDDPERFVGGKGAVLWGVVFIALAWFRGVTIAQRELTYQAALASYTAGLLLMVVLLIVAQGSDAATAIDAAALPYLMLGLLTLSLVHLSRAEYNQGDIVRGPWLATLLGTVGALAVVSAIIGLFPLDLLNRLLAPVGVLVLHIVDFIILIVAFPVALVVVWLINLLMGGRPLEMPRLTQVASQGAQQAQDQANQGGPAAFFVILAKTLFILALVALVAYILWRLFRRLRQPFRTTTGEETHESLDESGNLGEDLAALLGGMLGRFRRGPSEPEPDLPDDIRAVRRLYVRALRRAEAAGVPRPPAATPAEFAGTLAETLHTPSAATLSDRFAAARYGMVAPTPEELSELERGA